jgi:hypothetical protein
VRIITSDLTRISASRPTHPPQSHRQLFGSPAGATLALFSRPGTIAEAAHDGGLPKRRRNYSKKIYGKMGIASQADLIRLMPAASRSGKL